MRKILLLLSLATFSLSTIRGINHESKGALMQPEEQTLLFLLNSARNNDPINRQYSSMAHLFDQSNNEEVKVAITNTQDDEEVYETELIANGLGVDMETAPHIVFMDTLMDKYYFNRTLTIENLKEFIQDVREKRIRNFLRTEVVPESQEDVLLKKVVGDTFVKQIWESNDEILLYLHRANSKECHKFQKDVLSEVISRTKTSPKLKFFKMDSYLNEMINLPQLSQAPCLMFFKEVKGNNMPALYMGSHSKPQDIIDFLKAESQLGIEDPLASHRDLEL